MTLTEEELLLLQNIVRHRFNVARVRAEAAGLRFEADPSEETKYQMKRRNAEYEAVYIKLDGLYDKLETLEVKNEVHTKRN